MLRIKLILILMNVLMNPSESQNADKVLISYGKIAVDKIKGYDLVIIEGHHYSGKEVAKIKEFNKKVLAYVSLTEVNSNAHYFKSLKNYVLSKNANWNSYYLDLDRPEVKEILQSLLNEHISKGFHGFFFDNIDNVTKFGPHPEQQEFLIAFIKQIRQKYPKSYLIQNAGLELLKSTHTAINGILVESVISNYDFNTSTYQMRDGLESENYIDQLKTIETTYKLDIILVEYANSISLYDQLISKLKLTNFPYFIGDIELQNIPSYNK